jgi:hypothetical protein
LPFTEDSRYHLSPGKRRLPVRRSSVRPFDGTNAAVGEVEIEFQPTGAWHVDQRNSLSGPNGVFNYGFAERWEFILQGEIPAPEGAGPTSVPNGAFLKYLIEPGVLQDKPGPSIATEFGLLLPEFGGTGVGLSWNGIVSQRWDWGTAHFNVETISRPTNMANYFSTSSLKARTNGRSDRFSRCTPIVSSVWNKRILRWSEPSGRYVTISPSMWVCAMPG